MVHRLLQRLTTLQWTPGRIFSSTVGNSTTTSSSNTDQWIPGPERDSTWWPHVPRDPKRRVVRMMPLRNRQRAKIVLVPEGCTNRPFFTIQVKSNLADVKRPGLEQLGSWDPLPNSAGEQLISLNLTRIAYWIARGAEPGTRVAELLGLAGVLPVHPRSYLAAHRAKIATEQFQRRKHATSSLTDAATEAEPSGESQQNSAEEEPEEMRRPDSVWRRGKKPSWWWYTGLP